MSTDELTWAIGLQQTIPRHSRHCATGISMQPKCEQAAETCSSDKTPDTEQKSQARTSEEVEPAPLSFLPTASGPLRDLAGEEIEAVPLSYLPPLPKSGAPCEAPGGEGAEQERPSSVPPSSGWQVKPEFSSFGRKPPRKSDEPVLTLKILEDISELMEAYRLRYDVYESLNYLQQKNFSRLEIDEYDWYSIPFGAFSAKTGELLGTLRLITDRIQTPYSYKIQRILHESADDELTASSSKARPHPMPSINSSRVTKMMAKFNAEQRTVYEMSRMIVHPRFRGLGVSRGLMEFGLSCARLHGDPLLISSCIPQHVPLNERYGFMRLPGTVISVSDIVGQLANTIVCDIKALPMPTSARVAEIHRALGEGAMACSLDFSAEPIGVYRFSEGEAPSARLAAADA
jgi:predicted GNAT family N-acyltransferase